MPTLVSVFGVEPRRIGGTETFARELSLQLGQQGWKSVLCFLSEPSEQVRRFLDLPNISLAVYARPGDGSVTVGRNLAALTRSHRPDILHLHYVGFINFYSWIARLQAVQRIFFTDHHSRPSGYMPRRAPFWKRSLGRFINGPLTKVICVSNYGYRCMSSCGLLPRDRFAMIYNGVDRSRVLCDPSRAAEFRQRYSIPAERMIVTQVSWVIPEKGILDFLETARLVLDHHRNVQFVVVGEGAYREQYMKQAADKGIADRLTWTGMIEDPFSEGVFAAADVVCQLSQWEEVFGWMIAEAMAHGKPIVATSVGGIPELIGEGRTGFLVERQNAAAAAQKVMQLVQDAELRQAMGEAGRKLAAGKFDLKTNVAQLLELYQL